MLDHVPVVIDPAHVFSTTQVAHVQRELNLAKRQHKCSIDLVIVQGPMSNLIGPITSTSNKTPDGVLFVNSQSKDVMFLSSHDTCRLGQESIDGSKEILDHDEILAYIDKDLTSTAGSTSNIETEAIVAIRDAVPFSMMRLSQFLPESGESLAYLKKHPPENHIIAFMKFFGGVVGFFGALFLIIWIVCSILDSCQENKRLEKLDSLSEADAAIEMNESDVTKRLRTYNFYSLQRILREYRDYNKFCEIVCDARNKMIYSTEQKSAWATIWIKLLSDLRNLNERAQIFYKHESNAEEHDLNDARNALQSEFAALEESLKALITASYPRMTPDIKDFILGKTRLLTIGEKEATEHIDSVESAIKDVIKSLPPTMSEGVYVINEMQRRYLPDTVAAYLKAKNDNPQDAQKLLDEQLKIIEQGLQQATEAIENGSLRDLIVNGRFLRDRLAPHEQVALDTIDSNKFNENSMLFLEKLADISSKEPS